MIFVIGSGPAGIACAMGLVERGVEVTMLDAGYVLEQERRELVNKLSLVSKTDWDKAQIKKLKENTVSKVNGIATKYIYGSDFPYRNTEDMVEVKLEGVETNLSLARGGLSNVWGSVILPYLDKDVADWPIKIEQLAPHYQAVSDFMGIAGHHDELERIFPFYSDKVQRQNLSNQAKAFLNDMHKNKKQLDKHGISFGASRLAVNFDKTPGCAYCSLCMYGCPYDLIYSTNSTLDWLKHQPNFHYRDNVIVQKVQEKGNSVVIQACVRSSKEPLTFEASRVYLACGVLATTTILLRSMDAYNQTLTMKDSQYYLIPLLRFNRTANVDSEELYTLCQLFLELVDANISDNTIHLQLYTFNDLYADALQNLLGRFYPALKPLAMQLLSRMLLIQGYLHSDLSNNVKVTLKQTSANKEELALVANSFDRRVTEQSVRKVWLKLLKNSPYLKAVPSPLMINIAKAGRGYHSGGTFPMRENPVAFQSDIFGRPSGFKRVHAVDSTIFPSIPATTITFSVMANAHRIAKTFDEN